MADTPFRLATGVVWKVHMAIPYTTLLTESIVLELEDVTLELRPASEYSGGSKPPRPADAGKPGAAAAPASTTGPRGGNGTTATGTTSFPVSEWDATARDGKDMVVGMLNRVLSQIRVRVKNLKVVFAAAACPGVHAALHIPIIELFDETPVVSSTGVAEGGGGGGDRATAGRAEASTAGGDAALNGPAHKTLEVAAMYLTLVSGSGVVTPVVSIDSASSPVRLQLVLTPPEYSRKVPPVAAKLFIHQVP